MKTIYLQKSRKGQPIFFPIAIALVIALLGAALLYFTPGFSGAFGGVFGKPFWSAKLFVNDRLGYLGSFIKSRNSLIEENQKLGRQIDATKSDTLAFESLKSEHAKLLEAFGRNDEKSRLLAVVIAKPPESPYDTIILDVGGSLGVREGDKIYGFGNIALGEITSVSDYVSHAKLFSSGEMETHATVERSDQSIIIYGTGGSGFEAKVPQDADVVVGDIIVLPSKSVSILGAVIDVESSVTSSFKRVLIQTPLNINHIRWVEVAIDGGLTQTGNGAEEE